jgi:hypothetical protein
MAKSKKAKSALPYARRLLEDEYVQEQLRNAAGGLRAAYDRVRKQRAQATEDKRLYGHVRDAATSIRKAATALQRPQPAPKPKRRPRKVAILAFAIAGTVWLTMQLRKQKSGASQPSGARTQMPPAPAGDEASAPVGATREAAPTTPPA